MFRDKVLKLINEFGIKRQSIIELIGSNRVSFPKKIENNSFEIEEQNKILSKYGGLL